MQMNLLCISPGYWPAFQLGGPIVSVHALNKALVKRGINVTVYATIVGLEGRVPVNQEINIDGIKVIYFGFKKFFEFIGTTGWQFSPEMTSALKRALKTFDLIHINAIWNYPSLAAAYLCKKYRKPYILTPRGTLYPYTIRKKIWKKWPYYTLIMDRYVKSASAIHYTTDDEKEQCHATLGLKNQAIVIPNGIDLSEFENLPPKETLGERYPILKDKKVILFLGRINWKKGLDILVEAYAKLAGERPDIHLLIAGNDEEGYGEKVKRWIRDHGMNYEDYGVRGNPDEVVKDTLHRAGGLGVKDIKDVKVTFTGMLTGKDKLEVLAGSDIFVLPSYSENFGMAVLEAMACGLPVIISNQVGIHKEITEANAGVVINTKIVQIAEAIANLLDNPHICKEMSENGRQLVEEQFTWDKVADGMIEAYGEIVNEWRI